MHQFRSRNVATPSLQFQQLRFQQHDQRRCEDPADFLSPKGSLALAGAHAASMPNLTMSAAQSVGGHVSASQSLLGVGRESFGMRRAKGPAFAQSSQRLAGVVEEEFIQKRLEAPSLACAEQASLRNMREILALCKDFQSMGQGQGLSTLHGRVRGLDMLYNRRPHGVDEDEMCSDVDETELDQGIKPVRARTILEQNSYFKIVETQCGGTIDKLAMAPGVRFVKVPAGTVLFRQGDPGCNCYVVVSGQVAVFQFNFEKMAKDTQQPSPRSIDLSKNVSMKARVQSKRKKTDKEIQEEGSFKPRSRTLEAMNSYNEDSTLGDSLTLLDAGVHFGEQALLNDAPRAATIKCTKDCEVLSIPREPFHRIMAEIKAKVKFFQNFFPEVPSDYAHAGKHFTAFFHEKEFLQGHMFFREGIRSLEPHLYIVLGGTIEFCRYASSSDNPTYVLASRPLESKSWKAVCSRPMTGVAGSSKDEKALGAAMSPDRGTQVVWDRLGKGDVFCSVSFFPISCSEPFTVSASEDCVVYSIGVKDQLNLSPGQRRVFQQSSMERMVRRLRRVDRKLAPMLVEASWKLAPDVGGGFMASEGTDLKCLHAKPVHGGISRWNNHPQVRARQRAQHT